ncbi:MAG TPA: ABC transporter permease [Solirubrobacteraceae bacterium]|jgi:peptide/nickel transport system permease protein|nr:ABC transporter permease [Solirubrobacteraceae bacterium]
MLKYVGLRLLQAIPVLFGITIASFILIHLVPGNPARIQLGPRATAVAVRQLDRRLGLDRPLLSQYITFLTGAVHLSFGESLAFHQPVGGLIRSKVGATTLLMLYSFLISLLLTIPFALLAAVKRERAADHAIRIVGMTLFVMPVFWLGLLLALVFGLELGLLPTGGYGSGFGGALRSLTLPAVTLGLVMAPLFLRSLRASVIQTLDAGFIEAARARGFSEHRVLFRHCLRNASISTVTVIGLTMGALVSGTVVVENVFAIPGLGTLLVSSVSARDFPTIQGLVVVLALAVVLINLLTDLAYAAIDPRVRL